MQKFFPIIFGLIYLRVPAGATIYMVVSSAMRIGTQEFMFRTGMVTPVTAAEREIGGGAAPGKGASTKELGTGKPALNPGKPAAKSPGDRQEHRDRQEHWCGEEQRQHEREESGRGEAVGHRKGPGERETPDKRPETRRGQAARQREEDIR
jgi:hypothetical protein